MERARAVRDWPLKAGQVSGILAVSGARSRISTPHILVQERRSMSVVTIVEAYIFAALKRAVTEGLEDGTIVATIPELPGIIAYGSDVHECSRKLYDMIEGMV